MGADNLFRKCLFGGYNKEDVEAYVKKMNEAAQSSERDREMTVRVLKDAYYNAESMIHDASKKAEEILENAHKEARENREESLRRLQEELGQKALDFVTVKYRISDYIQQVESIQGSLGTLAEELKQVSEEIPAKVQDMIGESEQEHFLDAEYKKPGN